MATSRTLGLVGIILAAGQVVARRAVSLILAAAVPYLGGPVP
jgi:hypothetical protein